MAADVDASHGSGGGASSAIDETSPEPRVTASASPRVSIVIPTYNSESHLAATISSVLLQTFTDWELVVYDDGSSDATVELAERCTDGEAHHAGASPGTRYESRSGSGAAQPRFRGNPDQDGIGAVIRRCCE